MCLCVLLYHQGPTQGLVMAANREERYDRPADPPAWICHEPGIFAGRDRTAGGTWQGVNEHGLLVSLTNRTRRDLDPSRRSRGHLCLDALGQPSARACADWLTEHLARTAYNPCNLLWADREHAVAAHADTGGLEVLPLGPGIHLLSDTDVNDESHPRIARARELLTDCPTQPWPDQRAALAGVLADHAEGGSPEAAICRHGEVAGTVSSSVIRLDRDGSEDGEFWFAAGAPCRAEWEDLTPALQQRGSRD